jgi:hypothetical protein
MWLLMSPDSDAFSSLIIEVQTKGYPHSSTKGGGEHKFDEKHGNEGKMVDTSRRGFAHEQGIQKNRRQELRRMVCLPFRA